MTRPLHPFYRWCLLVALLLLAIRLPPGQSLLGSLAEVLLSQQLAGEVRIGRLRTNLWHEVRLQDVEFRPNPGSAALLRIRSAAVVMKSGPLSDDGIRTVALDGVAWTSAAAGHSWVNTERGVGTTVDLRRWIPDLFEVRDLTLDSLQVSGRLFARREADAPGRIVRVHLVGNPLLVGVGRQSFTIDAAFEVGRRWAEATRMQLLFDGGRLEATAGFEAAAFDAAVTCVTQTRVLSRLLPAAWQSQTDLQSGTIELNLRAHGRLTDPLVHVDGTARDLGLQMAAVRNVAARGTWTAERSHLDTFAIDSDIGQLRGSIETRGWGAGAETDGQLRVQGLDLGALAEIMDRQIDVPISGQATGDIDWQGLRSDAPGVRSVAVALSAEKVAWEQTKLGAAALHVDFAYPDLSGQLHSEIGDLHVDGQLHNTGVHDLDWRLQDIDLKPLRGWSGVDSIAGTGRVTAHSSGSWWRPQVEMAARLQAIRIGGLVFPRVHVDGGLDTSSTFTASVTDGGTQTHLLATGSWAERQLHVGTLSIAGTDVSRYLTAPRAELWQGALTATLDLQGDLEHPEAVGTFRLDGLALRGQPLGDLQWRVSLAEGQVHVAFSGLDSTVRLLGTLDLETRGLPFQLRGGILDAQLRPFLALLTSQPLGYDGNLRATIQLDGELTKADELRAQVGLLAMHVSTPVGGLALSAPASAILQDGLFRTDTLAFDGSAGRMRVAGSVARDGPLDLHYELDDLGLDFLEPFLRQTEMGLGGRLRGRVDLSGTAGDPALRGQIEIADLRLLERRLGDLSATMAYAGSIVALEGLRLDLPAGGTLSGTASAPLHVTIGDRDRKGQPIGYLAELALAQIVLDRDQGLPEGVQAQISGVVRLQAPADRSTNITGSLDLTQVDVSRGMDYRIHTEAPLALRLHNGSLSVLDSASFAVVNNTLIDTTVGHIQISGATGQGSGRGLQLLTDGIDLAVLAQLMGLPQQISGVIGADLQLLGTLQQPDLLLNLSVPVARFDSLDVEALSASIRYEDGQLSLQPLHAQVAGGELEVNGQLHRNGLIGLRAVAADIDIAPLQPWLPGLAGRTDHLSGRLSGLLQLDGTSAQPSYAGSLSIQDGAIGVSGLRPQLTFDAATVRLAADSLTVSGLRGRDGTWEISAASHLGATGVRHFDTSLRLQELRLDMPGTLALTTTGYLHWLGTTDSSKVRGSVEIDDGHITEEMSLRTLSFAAPDSTRGMADDAALADIDLAVTLKGRDLRLDNELAQIPFAMDLLLHGTAASPILQGELLASEGAVQYLGHEFLADRVRFAFDKERGVDDIYALFHDPARLDPTIDFRSHTEVEARNGNEYTIYLGLSGPFTAIDLQLTSDPPEEEMDVLSLLRFGKTGVPMLDARGSMLNTKANLSPNYLLSMTESSFSRVLGLDNVQIDNSVLKPGQLSGSRIVLTKQLGKRTEMTYSTTVGYAAEGRVQLQYDLGYNVFVQTQHDAKGESGVDLNLKLKFR